MNLKPLTAAIFWKQFPDKVAGTGWLCSDRYLLTAAHCVLDLRHTELNNGPFQLRFPWGQIVCEEIAWWDVELDVALLAIDPASIAGVAGEIKQLRTNVIQASFADDKTWNAYGFPIAKPTGLTIDGTITDPDATITERLVPAIQLHCKQGGSLARYDADGNVAEFDDKSEIMALTGASGAAVVHRGEIIGLVRSAPPRLGQREVFATPLSAIAQKRSLIAEIFEQTRQNHIELIRTAWLAWESSEVGPRLIDDALEGRPDVVHVHSEIYELWNRFIDERGWHEDIGNHLQFIRDSASKVSELDWLVERIDRLDLNRTYRQIVNDFKENLKNTNNRVSQLLRDSEEIRRQSYNRKDWPEVQTQLDNNVEQVRTASKGLYELSQNFEPPLFRRCFLIIGSTGAGKTHFISQLLAGDKRKSLASQYLVLPLLSPRKDGTIDDLLLEAIRTATGQTDWTSLDEFCNLLAQRRTGDAPGSNQRPLKLVVAIDDLDKWIFLRGDDFRRELTDFIESRTTLHNLFWVITCQNANFDKLCGDRFWTDYAAIRAMPRTGITETEYRWRNFGGWYSLDGFNESYRVGLKIIRAAYANKDDAETLEFDSFNTLVWALEWQDPEGSRLRNLSNPFIAWIVADLIESKGIDWSTLDLSFVEFVDSFWEKRKSNLASALANRSINKAELSEGELDRFVWVVAKALTKFPDLYPGRSALMSETLQLAQKFSLEHNDHKAVESIVGILNQGNLLRSTAKPAKSGFGPPPEQQIEILIETFWEYYIATGLIDPDSIEEAQAGPLWQRLQTIATRQDIREGICIFLFLLLARESDNTSFAGLLEELLDVATDADEVLSPSIWFAGQKGTPALQEKLSQLARDRELEFSQRHQLYAFMAFVCDCSSTVLPPIDRLILLQPHYELIQKFELSDFYYFVADSLARQLDGQDEAVQWMHVLTGCEEMDCAPQLAKLTVAVLRDAFLNNRTKMLNAVIGYLQELSNSGEVRTQPPRGKKKPPYYYREFLMREICERLINANSAGVATYNLLDEAGWYDRRRTGVVKTIALEMEQQANIAFGHWFRSRGDFDLNYVKLVRKLADGNKIEKEKAFYLIRHTVSMKGPQNVEVAYELRRILRKLYRDPKMKGFVKTYRRFFALNIKPAKRRLGTKPAVLP